MVEPMLMLVPMGLDGEVDSVVPDPWPPEKLPEIELPDPEVGELDDVGSGAGFMGAVEGFCVGCDGVVPGGGAPAKLPPEGLGAALAPDGQN